MKPLFTIIIMSFFFILGCTYSITMVHTTGEAQDVVDETATNTPSTKISVPISATQIP